MALPSSSTVEANFLFPFLRLISEKRKKKQKSTNQNLEMKLAQKKKSIIIEKFEMCEDRETQCEDF